jgi:hypothetical protein
MLWAMAMLVNETKDTAIGAILFTAATSALLLIPSNEKRGELPSKGDAITLLDGQSDTAVGKLAYGP